MKRIVLILFFVFVLPKITLAAFGKAQTGVAGSASSGNTVTCTFTKNPSLGDLVAVGLLFYDGGTTPPTVTIQDGNGNNYVVESNNSRSNYMDTAGWVGQGYLINAPLNASKSITATFNNPTQAAAIWCDDFTVSGGIARYQAGAYANGASDIIIAPTATSSEGYQNLLYETASDQSTVYPALSPWTENEGGQQFGNTAGWIINATKSTAASFQGSVGWAWNCVTMSFVFVPTPRVQNFLGTLFINSGLMKIF